MKKMLSVVVLVLLLSGGLVGQALAFGWGAYVEGAQGSGEIEYTFTGDKVDADAEATGYGLVFDSDLRGEFNHNLRLNIGYEKLDLENDFGETLELEGLTLAGTLGFPLGGRESYHWWIGPQLRLGFYSGDVDSIPNVDYDLAAFGVGGVLGFNYITRSNICISTSAGFVLSGYAGEATEFGSSIDVEGSTATLFANLAFLFGN